MIVAGALIVREVLDHYGLDAIRFSVRDLLDGAALEAAALPPAPRARRLPGRTRAAESAAARVTLVALLAGCGGSTKQAASTAASKLPPGCTRRARSTRSSPASSPGPTSRRPPFFQVYAAYETDGRTFLARDRGRRSRTSAPASRSASATA